MSATHRALYEAWMRTRTHRKFSQARHDAAGLAWAATRSPLDRQRHEDAAILLAAAVREEREAHATWLANPERMTTNA